LVSYTSKFLSTFHLHINPSYLANLPDLSKYSRMARENTKSAQGTKRNSKGGTAAQKKSSNKRDRPDDDGQEAPPRKKPRTRMKPWGGAMLEREAARIFQLPYKRANWKYFILDHSRINPEGGKALITDVGYIPAGTLLWSENSVFEGFREWQKKSTRKQVEVTESVLSQRGRLVTQSKEKVWVGDRRETKTNYHERVQALWDGMGEEQKTIFTNFVWFEDEGDGKLDFTADDMEARIYMNAGPEPHDQKLSCAYGYLNFVSHSCRPNCRIVDCGPGTQNGRWQLRTLVPILDKGTELTIDYDDYPQDCIDVVQEKSFQSLIDSVEHRNKDFYDCYGFRCDNCEACEDPTTDKTRDTISRLHERLMLRPLPDSEESEDWLRWAAIYDKDMNKYTLLLKSQKLFPMALKAHERAWKVYQTTGRKLGEIYRKVELKMSDRAKGTQHLHELIGMRRLLYGAWDRTFRDLLNEGDMFPDDNEEEEQPNMFSPYSDGQQHAEGNGEKENGEEENVEEVNNKEGDKEDEEES
jgi:hypothetical protein